MRLCVFREVTMRYSSLFHLILLALSVALFAPTCGFAQTRETNLFSETGYDFKGIPRNTEPRHSFVFVNNGASDLTLVSARVSCQCTKVFIPQKRVYKPGEKGEVVAQIDGVRFTGVRHVTVTVTFQRGSTIFEVPLNVTGVIIDNVALRPQKLTFLIDQNEPGATATKTTLQMSTTPQSRSQQTFVVFPARNETVSRVQSSSPYLDVKIGKPASTATGTQTPLTVSVKDDAPAGYIDATVQVWSNGASTPSPLLLSVTGVVRAPLTVSPSTLTFFTSEKGEKIVKNFTVAAPNEFTIKGVKAMTKALECKYSPKAVRPAKVCVVPVTFDPELLTEGLEQTKLRIETTDGRVLFLDVQISSGNFALKGLSPTPVTTAEKTVAQTTNDLSQDNPDPTSYEQVQPSVMPGSSSAVAHPSLENRSRNTSANDMSNQRRTTPVTIPSSNNGNTHPYPGSHLSILPFGLFSPGQYR